MGGLEELVARHDVAIENMAGSIDRLANAVEKSEDKMDKIIDSLSQNGVILEKLANIDSSNKDSINRIHKRIDDTLLAIAQKEKSFENRLSVVEQNAHKGSRIYDLAVFTVKAITWALPISAGLLAGLLWIIEHS